MQRSLFENAARSGNCGNYAFFNLGPTAWIVLALEFVGRVVLLSDADVR